MYPQYWTPGIGGYCYMKYSYEYKRMCVEMYREGKWPENVPRRNTILTAVK